MNENKIQLAKYAHNFNEYSDRVIINDYMITKFVDRAFSQKKRNVQFKDAESCIKSIFAYLMLFNSLEEDTVFLGGHPLNQWPILNEFKDFIIPNSLRWKSGDKSFKDVLVRTSMEPAVPLDFDLRDTASITEYTNLLSEFRSYFKKDATSDYMMLDTLRIDKSIAEVYDVIVYSREEGDLCHFDNTSFIPVIRMEGLESFASSLFNSWYLNAQPTEIYDMYIANLFF